VIDLTGKIALVTGAASGIGAETARLFGELGATCWLADRDEAAAAATCADPPRARTLSLDVRSPADWHSAETSIGTFDILVNAAGISRTPAPADVADVDLDAWRDVFAVNVEGTLLGCQMAMRTMRYRGAIVNIASTAGICPSATLAAYGASKAAVLQLTRSVAAWSASDARSIRCNAVQPGMIDTPMTSALPPAMRRRWKSQIPLGTFGKANDVANAIAYLVSAAAAYVNGTALSVDGGMLSRPVVAVDRLDL
jgi:3(or 17)beta-hydroxysteroid dehydrogenase